MKKDFLSKEIINQLQKAYVAVKNAESDNEVRIEPNIQLRNKLITIKELIKEILSNKEEL